MKKLPILLLILALIGVLYFELHDYLTFATLKENHHFLLKWTHDHQVLSGLLFTLFYVVAVALSLPVAVYLNVTSGFLFGMIWGTVYAVVGATVGACILFWAVNTAYGEWLEQKASGWIKDMEHGFQRNALNYLLALRLVPIIPFWVTNIVAALFNVPIRTFVLTTFFGIIPETALYIWMGTSLEHMFHVGETPTLDMVFAPSILIPLLALAILPLIPLIYKKITSLRKSG